MITLIITTIAYFATMLLFFALVIFFCIHEVRKEEAEGDTVVIGMLSVLGLIWSIISVITFYKVLL